MFFEAGCMAIEMLMSFDSHRTHATQKIYWASCPALSS